MPSALVTNLPRLEGTVNDSFPHMSWYKSGFPLGVKCRARDSCIVKIDYLVPFESSYDKRKKSRARHFAPSGNPPLGPVEMRQVISVGRDISGPQDVPVSYTSP